MFDSGSKELLGDGVMLSCCPCFMRWFALPTLFKYYTTKLRVSIESRPRVYLCFVVSIGASRSEDEDLVSRIPG